MEHKNVNPAFVNYTKICGENQYNFVVVYSIPDLYKEQEEAEGGGFDEILQVFRIFKLARIFKLGRHSPGLQSIAFTLKMSYRQGIAGAASHFCSGSDSSKMILLLGAPALQHCLNYACSLSLR
jgi:hypothetical protein